MTTDATETGSILDTIALEELGTGHFRGRAHPGERTRTYGGEVAGQAVLAASRTVPADRHIHAAHTYFLLPGDTTVATEFLVDDVRDGGSFSVRRVEARQGERVIFTMLASFQADEPGISHQPPRPAVPDPADLQPAEDLFGGDDDNLAWLRRLSSAIGVDIRFPEPPGRVFGARGEATAPRQRAWLRSRSAIPAGRAEEAAAMTYLSDLFLLATVLNPHGVTIQDPTVQNATINHSVWFHAPLRVDEWFLYEQESRWAGGARGLAHGEIYDAAGTLCATTMQEGLVRLR
jgi:acyl-CoA thioesterase-2